jgi:SAM-dependent methyltransferase
MLANAERQEFPDLEAKRAALRATVAALAPTGRPVQVLEAGGGDATHFDFLASAEFTVVDLSPEQLARNAYAKTKLQADLQTFSAYPTAYDLVAANDVLEHLPEPDKALDILIRQVKPGGMMVLAGPDPKSFKGLITKFTPHGFHVWVYRRLAGYADAGKPGHVPFPAFLRWSVTPEALIARARAAGLEVRFYGASGPSWMMDRIGKRAPLVAAAYRALGAIMRALSFGRWRPDLSDVALVLQRPA